MSPPDSFEAAAIQKIHTWKHPDKKWLGRVTQAVNWPLDQAGDAVMKTPGVGSVVQKSAEGILSVGNDLAQRSVRTEAIHRAYHKAGHDGIFAPRDIHELSLEDVDEVIGWLGAKYRGIAVAEGGVSGAVGLPGIPPDIIALVTLNLRAIGEYAAYCGFSVNSQEERLFVMNVLGLASSPTDASKTVALAQLVRIGKDIARDRTWKQLQEHSFVVILRQIAKVLGVRLTKAKLAQILPAVGALVGAGFNSYYTSRVCDAAYHLYRERFLAAKYGPDIIEESVTPATDPMPEQPEVFEAEELIAKGSDRPD